MAENKIYAFKATIDLEEAIRRIVFKRRLQDASEFLRNKIMSDKDIKTELKNIADERAKVHEVCTTSKTQRA